MSINFSSISNILVGLFVLFVFICFLILLIAYLFLDKNQKKKFRENMKNRYKENKGYEKTTDTVPNFPFKNGDIVVGAVDKDGNTYLSKLDQDCWDRYGDNSGEFTSQAGTPFTMRSRPVDALDDEYHMYQLTYANIEDGWSIERSLAAPWFGEQGGGIQFRVYPPQELIDKYAKINRKPPVIHEFLKTGYIKEVLNDGN